MAFRDITMDDMKDVKLSTGATLFDALVATAARAKEIFDQEGAAPKTRPKGSTERTAAAAAARISDDEDAAGTPSSKRRKKTIRANKRDEPLPQPPLPQEFRNAIEEVARRRNAPPPTARMLIQKRLFKTDTSEGHNRLSIPIGQIEDDFLTEEEKRLLASYDENKKKKFVEVTIFEPSLAAETVKFSRWDMPKKNGGKTSSSYVINGKWNDIVGRNKLEEGMVVQLWCFRVHPDLFFALVRLPH